MHFLLFHSDTDSCSPQDLTIQADVSSPSGNNQSESSSSLEYRMYNPTVTSQNAYTVSINYPRGDEEGGGGKTSHMNRYLNLYIRGWITECIE